MPRITANLSREGHARLESIKELYQADSFNEVFKRALWLFELALNEENDGGALWVVRPNGERFMLSVGLMKPKISLILDTDSLKKEIA